MGPSVPATSMGRGVLQTTLASRVSLSGIGVHSGKTVGLSLGPAAPGTGITFVRTGLEGGASRPIPADFFHVGATDHCTTLLAGNTSIATVEHLLATLAAIEVDNVTIEIDGPEVPVMDGSAIAFLDAVDQAGVAALPAPRSYIRVLQPIRVERGGSVAEILPYDGRRVEVEIDFENPMVGRQSYGAEISPLLFRNEIARARTFGFLCDVERLWAQGFALGASLDNAVVIGDGHIVNPEGLRYADEFARHKALDAVGDLALAGAPILGLYRSYRGGHALNVSAVRALFAAPDAWERVEMPGVHRTLEESVGARAAVALQAS